MNFLAETAQADSGSNHGASEFRNEPPMDFSIKENRVGFAQAIERARAMFPIHAPLIIGNRRVETKETIGVASPNDIGLKLGDSAAAGADEAAQAIEAARKAFEDWSRTPAERRAAFLQKAADRLRGQRMELAALEVHEAAKPWREADADVCEAIDFLEYYAGEILRLARPLRLQPHVLGERNDLSYAALGVVGVIGPWNFPMAIPVGMMAAAVAAGNTVVWKPAEQTPLITHRVMEAMIDSGLPPGVVNHLPGRGEVAGQALVESPEVQMIVFTGSREVGLKIIRECAMAREGQHFVKRVVAEMGGKNALIIDATADLDAAVPDIIESAFGFSGQKCSACSRLIVLDEVYRALTRRLRDAMASLEIAPSTDPGCQIPPVIDAQARAKIERYIGVGCEEGRALHVGDVGSLSEKGHFAPPAAFDGIVSNHRLAREEIFGPVLAVMRARDFDHAIEIANGTDYALTGGVHSRTPSHLEQARTRYQCGNLYLCRPITGAIVGRQPFGGFKLSGIGSKAGGPDYLKQFLVARSCSENLMRHGAAPLDG